MSNWKRLIPSGLAAALLLSLLSGCAKDSGAITQEEWKRAYVDRVALEGEVLIEDEAAVLSARPADLSDLSPVASGTLVKENSRAVIDYSNTADGYVMVKFTGTTSTRIKVQVAGPSYAKSELVYTYDLPVGQWVTFPLSDGNGSYTVTVLENTHSTKYAKVISASFSVTLADEFAPFLRPNQYVDYASAPKTVAKAAELAGKETDALKLVEIVYNYVVQNLTYDKKQAATVKSGYLPVLDDVLARKKGICFDYASLMTGMLRSQGVPCKLVVGYAGKAYHAWISVWSEEDGWVDGAIYFDGSAWQRMDPTFASSGKGSAAIMKYIGNGKNYSPKYLY